MKKQNDDFAVDFKKNVYDMIEQHNKAKSLAEKVFAAQRKAMQLEAKKIVMANVNNFTAFKNLQQQIADANAEIKVLEEEANLANEVDKLNPETAEQMRKDIFSKLKQMDDETFSKMLPHIEALREIARSNEAVKGIVKGAMWDLNIASGEWTMNSGLSIGDDLNYDLTNGVRCLVANGTYRHRTGEGEGGIHPDKVEL